MLFVAVQLPIPCRGGRPLRTAATCRDQVRGGECDRPSVSPAAEDPGVQVEECREAGDWEKQKAASAAAEVVSALVRYSKFTGRMVCGKRCGSAGAAPLSSSLTLSLGRIKQSFVLTDPHLPDMPIVYASEAFLSLTGYSSHEVLGRNCRFLNGPDTDPKVLYQIRNNIESQQAGTVRLLNYRKDGSLFWNLLHISPVRNASGKIAFYVGVQMDEGSEQDGHGLSLEMRQLGAVGAVKVAVRSLFARVGPSRLP